MSSVDLAVTNARVVTPTGTLRGGVAADEGEIVAVGSDRSLPKSTKTIDAGGNYLIPGLIDPHFHIGIMGNVEYYPENYFEAMESQFETETCGSLHGGTTTILNFLMQEDAYVPHLDYFQKVGNQNSYVDFGFHAMVFNDTHIDEIKTLASEGIRSFKLFFNMYKNSDPEFITHSDASQVYRVLDKVSEITNALVMFHAENDEVGTVRRQELQKAGRDSLSAWADAYPGTCQAMQIEQIGMLTKLTDSTSYIVHNSMSETIDSLRRYQESGVDIHGETLYAFLGRNCEEDIGSWGKISPPIGYPEDQEALWKAIKTGVIDHVGSDSNPYTLEYRGPQDQNIWEALPGDQAGAEYGLGVMLTEGVNKNRISMERLVEVTSTNNAKRFGLYPQKGVIAEGADADLVIVDLDKTAVVDDEFLHSMETRYSSMHGKKLQGLPTHTIKDGEVVVKNGKLFAEKGIGSYLSRGSDNMSE